MPPKSFVKASQLNNTTVGNPKWAVKNSESEQVKIDISIEAPTEGQEFLNVVLKVEGQQFSGLPVQITEFELASTFINTQFGKPRARLNLSESQSLAIAKICSGLREIIQAKLPDAELRDWIYNNTVDVGFPTKTDENGVRHSGSVKVRCGTLLHEMELTQINDRLAHLAPQEVDGRLNIWLRKSEEGYKGGFYFTVTRIVFDQ